jgi:hypothetical protein
LEDDIRLYCGSTNKEWAKDGVIDAEGNAFVAAV